MTTAIQIPTLLRIKPNTLYKLGKYLRRNDFNRIALFYGEGMEAMLGQTVEISLDSSEIKVRHTETVTTNDIEAVVTSAFAHAAHHRRDRRRRRRDGHRLRQVRRVPGQQAGDRRAHGAEQRRLLPPPARA